MLPQRDIDEIVQIFNSTTECKINLISQYHTVPDIRMESGAAIYGIECSPRGGVSYIIQKSMLEAELKLICKDYHYYSIISKGSSNYYCNHEWIDVGFHFTKLVCKKCDKEKGDSNG